jgi:hypothetical protein
MYLIVRGGIVIEKSQHESHHYSRRARLDFQIMCAEQYHPYRDGNDFREEFFCCLAQKRSIPFGSWSL